MQAKQGKIIGTDFTEGPVMSQLLKFFLPFLLANLLNSLYNTVDTIIIGQFVGNAGILAVTMGGKMLNLFTNVGLALAGGGQVLIAQQIGAGQREELNSSIGTLFTEMAVLAVVFAAGTFALSRDILTWLNTPDEAFNPALAYLRITCVGLPLIFGYNAVSCVLRGMGDSKSPLLFIAIAAVVNLIGDIIFIVCFGLGAAGTAYATVIGQGVSLVFSIVVLYRRREHFGFDFKLRSFAVDWEKLGIIMKIGLPMALRSCCITITQLVLLSYVNLYTVAEATAYSIGDKIVHLTNIFSLAVKQAAGTMVGQNIGAGREDRVCKVMLDSGIITVGTALVLVVLSLLFPTQIFRMFSKDADVLALAADFMRIACIIYLLAGIMGPYDSIVTGTGNSLLGFLGGFLDGVVFRIAFSFLFAYALDMGVTGFFMGDALARLGPIIIGALFYHTGAWRRYKKLVKAKA